MRNGIIHLIHNTNNNIILRIGCHFYYRATRVAVVGRYLQQSYVSAYNSPLIGQIEHLGRLGIF